MNRTSTILFWFSITLMLSLGLYHTSYRVDRLTKTLQGLNMQITNEQRDIHILKAEWVYLSSPVRIEQAARKHLSLQPTKTEQISSLTKLATRLVAQKEDIAQNHKLASTTQYRTHPVAADPHIASNEGSYIKHRLTIGKTSSYRLSTEDSYEIGSIGGAP